MTASRTVLQGAASLLVLASISAPVFANEHVQRRPEHAPSEAITDIIVVTGFRFATEVATDMAITPETVPLTGADAAGLVARLPGVALIDNGSISGQVQYRGLFGARAPVTIDGVRTLSGGPNLMDPPLQGAPLPLIARIEVDRGVAPVSEGPGLGGGTDVVLRRIDFTGSHDWTPSAEGLVAVRSVDGSHAVGGIAGGAAEGRRFELLFSREEGGDIAFSGGQIPNSHHDRTFYGLGGGLASGNHAFDLSLRRIEVGETGNAPFAMDIDYVEHDVASLSYAGSFDDVTVDLHLGWNGVSHGMDNFSQRSNSDPMRHRYTRAEADGMSFEAEFGLPALGGTLNAGGDIDRSNHDVLITNPNNAAFSVTSLPDVRVKRLGVFAEWTGVIAGVNSELGIRADRHLDAAGAAMLGAALPAGPRMLANAFNAADRDIEETTVDGVARFWRDAGEALTWRLTVSRKTRAPGYVERFAWLPTEASGGLADGNVYVGDLHLQSEVSWSIEAGFDYRADDFYVRPTIFSRRVDDFIQGVPYDATPGVIDSPVEMVAAMNGDPTPLRFANVAAGFHGIDADFGWRLSPSLSIDGVASLVRGERRDIDDALYRMSPARLLLDLTYERADWSVSLEGQFVADQTRVSRTNDELPTEGYAVFGANLDWYARDNVLVTVGVENILDADYERHLAGYNRVAGSDVAVGDRLPGSGRGVYARIGAGF